MTRSTKWKNTILNKLSLTKIRPTGTLDEIYTEYLKKKVKEKQ